MARIAKGATVSRVVRRIALGLAAAGFVGLASAQTPAQPEAPAKPAAPATYKGCVQKAPNSSTELVIKTATSCAKLTGQINVDQLAGHQVELTGMLTPRSGPQPATIKVDSVGSVGETCSDVCSLTPPRSRGLGHGGEIPGSEGGTPGLTAPTKPPQ